MARKKLEYCYRGHLRDDAHTYIDSKGFAQCRECQRIRQENYRKRRRARDGGTHSQPFAWEARPWVEQHEPIEPF